MVTGALRGQIRAQVAKLLMDRCTIERETSSIGRYGEPIHAWEAIGTEVPCRLLQAGQFNTPPDFTSGTQETMPELYRLIVGHTTALDINTRVTVSGLTYSVVRLETALTDEGFHAALVARERGAG